MKVLHLATGNNGGAYQAAVRLSDLLEKNGTQSGILTSSDRQPYKRILSKFYTTINKVLTRKEFGIMSIYSMNGLDLTTIASYKPDVIHIHNWFNLLSLEGMTKLSSIAPVVITLHDERLITGGCHNHLECSQIVRACGQCPALTLPIFRIVSKERIASNNALIAQRNNVIVPSKWMASQLKLYVNADLEPKVIPNPVDEIFYDLKKEMFSEYNVDSLRIGFIAANPWVKLKGLTGLLDSLSEIEQTQSLKFSLKIVGKVNNQATLPAFADAIGVKSGKSLVEFLDQLDFLVVSSLSENFPNIITEAQLRGIVVIATNVGGIPEMISDEITGFLQQGNETLSSLLTRAISTDKKKLEEIGTNARLNCQARVNQQEVFSRIMSVYKKAISNER